MTLLMEVNMVQIEDICKEYHTGDLVQKALDHVSLNLRDNEFVAILGPSGSGKTTLLNIIGGLDHYDSGDLIINGISTKKYNDRDWDSYRNHTIGFVFQSYNLIPHQTVLANVELALTISGISKAERTKRAKEALEKVGLGSQMHKKPNQMSGGQMQRVALARALVNDPDILLADEPTGALDSETSIQVMDLLKEVAKDRLVVMVTHNPELAEKYATRIVCLKDGIIRSDSNPYEIEEEERVVPEHRNMGKSSMSFRTAFSLSLNNLLTKKARTLLVAFAGSIGIIGIALILSLSAGVNQYIQDTEQETLSEYPLEITKNAMNMEEMMNQPSDTQKESEVKERDVVSSIFAEVTSNDLTSLKEYLSKSESKMDTYARSIAYNYDVEPQIFLTDTTNGVDQVNPNKLFEKAGFSGSSMMFSSNSFFALPKEEELYEDNYDVKAGRWPESSYEAVLVLGQNGEITDLTLYMLGMKDYQELENIVNEFTANGGSVKVENHPGSYQYKDFLDVRFKVTPSSSMYSYDESLGVWTDRSSDAIFMRPIVDGGRDLKIVGVVQPSEDSKIAMLSPGVNYSGNLQEVLMQDAKESAIVKQQMTDPSINVLTGNPFGTEENTTDLSKIFSIDSNQFASAIHFEPGPLSLKIDPQDMVQAMIVGGGVEIDEKDLEKILSNLKIDTSKVDLVVLGQALIKDFLEKNPMLQQASEKFNAYVSDPSESGAKAILEQQLKNLFPSNEEMQLLFTKLNQELIEDYSKSTYFPHGDENPMEGFEEYMQSAQAQKILQDNLSQIVPNFSSEQLDTILNALNQGYQNYRPEEYGSFDASTIAEMFRHYLEGESSQEVILSTILSGIDTDALAQNVTKQLSFAVNKNVQMSVSMITQSLQKSMTSALQSAMSDAFQIDPDALANAVVFKMDANTLQQTFVGMMVGTEATYEGNLSAFGYADSNSPSSITIYPKDFEAKSGVLSILDAYNKQMKAAGDEDKVVLYSDFVGALMSSITDIVNVISYVLITFVAISLVVSSIMIGVITYISVLERQKEIGILRAIGASKHNISSVFNAETCITGLLAGVIGVVLTEILLIPGNYLIHVITEETAVNAYLPLSGAILLIILSVVLTMIGGFLPAKKAAKSDPVKALRTE